MSKRRLNPIWSGISKPLIASLHSFTLFISRSIGFSQKIALPALAPIVINLVWVGVADAINIASISSEFIASSGELTTSALFCFATCKAKSLLMSYTYFKFASGCAEIISACILPMRPAPIREILIIIS